LATLAPDRHLRRRLALRGTHNSTLPDEAVVQNAPVDEVCIVSILLVALIVVLSIGSGGGFPFLFHLPGILLGAIGMHRTKDGRHRGRDLALISLIFGIAVALISIPFAGNFGFSPFNFSGF
jgi:nitrate reductase NapE component